jgi:hypothetical protein
MLRNVRATIATVHSTATMLKRGMKRCTRGWLGST